ncbi:MAG: hypothetical protein CMP20_15780 [Rickettsiales bacterium]|nr:hypothetical protein [Rickettsiales bacterium]
MLHNEYEDLLQEGIQQHFVLTRQGFGMGVLREGNWSSDTIVKYIYPKTKFEAYAQTYVRRTDFIVTQVDVEGDGRYMVTCRIGKKQAIKRPLTHAVFNQRPFRDETLREIIVRCYERWKVGQEPENPFTSTAIVSESSAGGFEDDQTSPFAARSESTDDSKGKSNVSSSTAPQYDYDVVYEYDDDESQ